MCFEVILSAIVTLHHFCSHCFHDLLTLIPHSINSISWDGFLLEDFVQSLVTCFQMLLLSFQEQDTPASFVILFDYIALKSTVQPSSQIDLI